MQFSQFDAHLYPQGGIEVGERFVQQEDVGRGDQRTTYCDALPLAAGKSFGLAIQQMRQLQDVSGLLYPLLNLGFVCTGQLQAELHVVSDGKVRVERIGLKYHTDSTLCWWDIIHALFANQ